VRRELVHDELLELMQRIKPDEPTQRLFKEIVLRRWNNEFKDATSHNKRLADEINACNDKKSRIIDLFIDGKLTNDEKNSKLAEVENSLVQIKLQAIEADKYVTHKEAIIDAAMLFMSDPGLFWNLSDITVKHRVQNTIFPEDLVYDFEAGFGTAKLADSYLLMQQVTDERVKYSSLVPPNGLEPLASP
jgi:hypothetical protein